MGRTGCMEIEVRADRMTFSRQQCVAFVENKNVVGFITALILFNAVTLGFETNDRLMEAYGPVLFWIDKTVLVVFTIELALKAYAYRWAFFRSGWNVFDFVIVAIAWMPATGAFAVLRALRVLRIMRLLSVVPEMRRVVGAIGHAIPGMTSVIGVLALLFYVAAVLATRLFGDSPDPDLQEWFGSIGASAYTLFQIMTLESWSMGIVRPVMELYPYSWLFFVPFIIITSFAVLNLFIGIIVDAMQSSHSADELAEEDRPVTKGDLQGLTDRLEKLSRDLEELKSGRKNFGA